MGVEGGGLYCKVGGGAEEARTQTDASRLSLPRKEFDLIAEVRFGWKWKY